MIKNIDMDACIGYLIMIFFTSALFVALFLAITGLIENKNIYMMICSVVSLILLTVIIPGFVVALVKIIKADIRRIK